MNVKEQIIYVMRKYAEGEYDTKSFCEALGTLYYFEAGGHRFFHGEEKLLLDELVAVTERFSPYEEDYRVIPNAYFSEEQVKKKFNEIAAQLSFVNA